MARGEKTGGRLKGTPNRSTANAREAIAAFVDGNADRLTAWLDRISKESPKDAFNCFMSVVEYHIPKLARSELTGKDGDTIDVTVRAGASEEVRGLISALTAGRADSRDGASALGGESKAGTARPAKD